MPNRLSLLAFLILNLLQFRPMTKADLYSHAQPGYTNYTNKQVDKALKQLIDLGKVEVKTDPKFGDAYYVKE